MNHYIKIVHSNKNITFMFEKSGTESLINAMMECKITLIIIVDLVT